MLLKYITPFEQGFIITSHIVCFNSLPTFLESITIRLLLHHKISNIAMKDKRRDTLIRLLQAARKTSDLLPNMEQRRIIGNDIKRRQFYLPLTYTSYF